MAFQEFAAPRLTAAAATATTLDSIPTAPAAASTVLARVVDVVAIVAVIFQWIGRRRSGGGHRKNAAAHGRSLAALGGLAGSVTVAVTVAVTAASVVVVVVVVGLPRFSRRRAPYRGLFGGQTIPSGGTGHFPFGKGRPTLAPSLRRPLFGR